MIRPCVNVSCFLALPIARLTALLKPFFAFSCFQVDSALLINFVVYVHMMSDKAAFLASPLASAATGSLMYVDTGLHAMGLAGGLKPTFSNCLSGFLFVQI